MRNAIRFIGMIVRVRGLLADEGQFKDQGHSTRRVWGTDANNAAI